MQAELYSNGGNVPLPCSSDNKLDFHAYMRLPIAWTEGINFKEFKLRWSTQMGTYGKKRGARKGEESSGEREDEILLRESV